MPVWERGTPGESYLGPIKINWLSSRNEDPYERHIREVAAKSRAKEQADRQNRAREIATSFHVLIEGPLKRSNGAECISSDHELQALGADLAQGVGRRQDWRDGEAGLIDLVFIAAGVDHAGRLKHFPDRPENFGKAAPFCPAEYVAELALNLGREMLSAGRILAFGLVAGEYRLLHAQTKAKRPWAYLSRIDGLAFILVEAARLGASAGGSVPKSNAGHSTNELFGQTGTAHYDAPFIAEGVRLVRAGECSSANEAAKKIVVQCGVLPSVQWSKGSGTVKAASPEAASDRLGRKISDLLKTNT